MAHNIEIIREAGVVVSMITGDNPITGMRIAKQIGLADNYTDEDTEKCLINAFVLFQNMEEEEAKNNNSRSATLFNDAQKGVNHWSCLTVPKTLVR